MDSKVTSENSELMLHTWVRGTGMGASHGARILCQSGFMPVENMRDAEFLGRENGFLHLTIPISPEDIWGDFYRSNSGRENVHIFKGEDEIAQFSSFEDAERWGQRFLEEENK